MPQYNFKEEFAPAVERGEKRQTIRQKRKRPTVPGDTLYLFTGLRTKHTRRLLVPEPICTAVKPVDIYPTYVILDGQRLSYEEATAFAKADGFPSLEKFLAFFDKAYGLPVVDTHETIYWNVQCELCLEWFEGSDTVIYEAAMFETSGIHQICDDCHCNYVITCTHCGKEIFDTDWHYTDWGMLVPYEMEDEPEPNNLISEMEANFYCDGCVEIGKQAVGYQAVLGG